MTTLIVVLGAIIITLIIFSSIEIEYTSKK